MRPGVRLKILRWFWKPGTFEGINCYAKSLREARLAWTVIMKQLGVNLYFSPDFKLVKLWVKGLMNIHHTVDFEL